MDKAQEEIARLEAESSEAQKRFVRLMGEMGTGEATVDEVCEAFREFGNLQLDAHELRIRAVANVIQEVGGSSGLSMESLGFTIPTIG